MKFIAGLILGAIATGILVMRMKHLVAVIGRGGKHEVTYLGEQYELKLVQKVEFY